MSSAPRIICSTGAFSRAPDLTSVDALISTAARVGADAFELIFYDDWSTDWECIGSQLREADLDIPVVHARKQVAAPFAEPDIGTRRGGLAAFGTDCRFARAVGADLVVLHLWDLPHSDRHLERNLSMLGPCLDIAADIGIRVAVETIPCATATPLANLQRVLDHDERVLASLDTEFLAMHDEMSAAINAAWLWRSRRLEHIHIKDYDGQHTTSDGRRRYLHPGEGTIEFDALGERIASADFHGFLSLEASGLRPDHTVDVARINASIDWLRTLTDGR